MDQKLYTIAGKKFKLKNFDDYTPNEEKKIKILLGIKDNDDDYSIVFKSKDNNNLLSLLLIPCDAVDINKFDFNNATNGQLRDIVTDWIAARFFFIKNMGNTLADSLQKKILQNNNTKINMAKPEDMNQNS